MWGINYFVYTIQNNNNKNYDFNLSSNLKTIEIRQIKERSMYYLFFIKNKNLMIPHFIYFYIILLRVRCNDINSYLKNRR